MRFLIILFSIIISGFNAISQDKLVSGLYFSSHEVVQDKRTSLNLTPTRPFKFSDGFSLEFDANFRKGDKYYGYIFRIIGDKKYNFDLVSNLDPVSSKFMLVLKDKVLCSFKLTDIPNGGFDRWIKIKFSINSNDSKLSLTINGNKQEIIDADIAILRNFEMIFGACRNSTFLNTDVSPMSLRDIRIFDAENKLIYEWKLSKHNQTIVYDEIEHAKAIAENPVWNIDSHVKWQKLKDLKVNNPLGITVDEENGHVFIVDNHAVYDLSIETSTIDTIEFEGGSSYLAFENQIDLALENQIIYNNYTKELWSYSFTRNEISKFNFISRKWSINGTMTDQLASTHHNKFISPFDSSLVTLFGYGLYTYKSVINRYDLKSKVWNKIDRSDQIQPRYLSGSGFLNKREMLVFGGFGSKTGRQEISPEHFYDLYTFNLSDYSFKKMWTLATPSKPFVPCDALIPDQQSGNFYTLIYNNTNYTSYLHLGKFGIDKSEYQLFNDSIPYSFLDTESWSSLFLDKKNQKLIAITSHDSDISVYSIAYPPLMQDEVYQKVSAKGKWYFWLFGILFAGVICVLIVFLFRKKKGLIKSDGHDLKLEHPNITPINPFERKTTSSIFFIGGFQVYNSKGQNITSGFSPTLKHLFLYLFLNTIKNGKGVSSVKLDEVLWYDKSGDSARNNRNVNISKLRSILDELDGAELVNENSLWRISLGHGVFCDYLKIINLFSKSKSNTLTEDEIHELISLLAFGDFLPAVQIEWMDAFKSRFASDVIDGLNSLFNKIDVENNLSLCYHLAECILIYDPMEDEAFAMKCSVLYKLGKKGKAKNLYDTFCKDYKKALGINYAVPFNEIIK